MIINSLDMCNFRQYIGMQHVEFSADPDRNVTVLIGVNTSGKTTIIRAFEWCLYGKNAFEDQCLLNSEVRDNMNVGDVQETWVAVSFTHDKKLYTIKRLAKYTCISRVSDGDHFVCELSKKPEVSVSLEYLQADGQTKTPINQQNITESMDRVLPRDLSDYFFFGGERISSIASRTDLTKAVRGLMRLDVLENARDHLKNVLKGFRGMIDTSGDINAQRARDSLETFKNQLQQYEEDRKNADAQMQYWKEKEDQANALLAKSNVEQVKKAKQERERLEAAIHTEEIRIENSKKAMVEAFNARPYTFFGMPAMKETLELLEAVKESTESIPAMEQEAIDYLLRRGRCICGTRLDPGTVPHQLVLAERKKLPPEQIGSVVNNFKNKVEGYLGGMDTYVETIGDRFKQYRTAKRHLGELQDELAAQGELIVEDVDAAQIEAKRKEAHQQYVDAKHDLETIDNNIGGCRAKIQSCEETIEKYAKSSTKNAKVAMLISYAEEVFNWLNDTYQAKEKTVREELQRRVNDNFSKMYHGERSIIIDDKYRVTYGDVRTEESPGLKAVKSFAFITSLVSMAKDKILDDSDMQLGQVYPIVMDAPFSNVDEIHIGNICRILPHTANQVIMAVMKKDWDYAAGNLGKYVGKSYLIAKDVDADGTEIDTSTHIKPSEV